MILPTGVQDWNIPVRLRFQVGVYPAEGIYNVPVEYDFLCKYANGIEMRVANASRLPHGMGTTWYGDLGWIHVDRGTGLSASDPKILEEVIGENEITSI